ncbi:putative quinol monooxygenase [Paenibacillus caui]|uniref:putative quinol monooxygenase n=1 Tax=Paenibacillus caui TaxID=2873927 RepID=UPI001CAA2364|nr:putative quinol monooxygenase [Paenibacillus caui]
MIVIHAHIKIQPAYTDIFLEKVAPLIAGSRNEAGNISYSLYRDIDQSNVFIMVEEWKDEEAVSFHNQTAHFTQFVSESKQLLLEPLQVKRFDVKE